MSSVQTTEDMSAAVQKTVNRVSLEYLKRRIANIEYTFPASTPHMTVAFVTMENGIVVIGKSAPADPKNFDPDMGKQFAEEDAIRQLWQLEGYQLRTKLADI